MSKSSFEEKSSKYEIHFIGIPFFDKLHQIKLENNTHENWMKIINF